MRVFSMGGKVFIATVGVLCDIFSSWDFRFDWDHEWSQWFIVIFFRIIRKFFFLWQRKRSFFFFFKIDWEIYNYCVWKTRLTLRVGDKIREYLSNVKNQVDRKSYAGNCFTFDARSSGVIFWTCSPLRVVFPLRKFQTVKSTVTNRGQQIKSLDNYEGRPFFVSKTVLSKNLIFHPKKADPGIIRKNKSSAVK